MAYSGVFSPLVDVIKRLSRQGMSATEISWTLEDNICVSGDANSYTVSAGMVSYILKKEGVTGKTTKIVQDWQTWTPEMQAAEDQRQLGYCC